MTLRQVRYPTLMIGVASLFMGCADTNKPTSRPAAARQRQEQAPRDPYGDVPDEEMPTVSGGGTSELDKKGFKRDWDRFWK